MTEDSVKDLGEPFADCTCDPDFSCPNHPDAEAYWWGVYQGVPSYYSSRDLAYEGRNRYKTGEFDV